MPAQKKTSTSQKRSNTVLATSEAQAVTTQTVTATEPVETCTRSESCAPESCASTESCTRSESCTAGQLYTEGQLYTTAQVKWFNNKAGYGFITVPDCEDANVTRDIFVHHSAIQVSKSQYKYLVQGEYVDIIISPSNSEAHAIQVSEVRGVNGGKLMCETRYESRVNQEDYNSQRPAQQQQQSHQQSQQQQAKRTYTQKPSSAQPRMNRAPQLSKTDEVEWMVVPRRKTTNTTTTTNQTTGTETQKRSKPQSRQPRVEIA